MKKRLVIANWKLYVESPRAAAHFVSFLRKRSRAFSGVEAVIAPSFPLIGAVSGALGSGQIKLGAQTLSSVTDPQHTGDVSAAILKHSGVSYVIVGHSERRAAGESTEMVAQQLAQALAQGLKAVLCVGEREREASGAHFSFIAGQLTSALTGVSAKQSDKLVIAYEPVWAIGKSAEDAMKPAELREMAIFIKKTLAERFERKTALKVPILYGGSVEPLNARALVTEAGVSGFLVGHASADADSFIEILKACKK